MSPKSWAERAVVPDYDGPARGLPRWLRLPWSGTQAGRQLGRRLIRAPVLSFFAWNGKGQAVAERELLWRNADRETLCAGTDCSCCSRGFMCSVAFLETPGRFLAAWNRRGGAANLGVCVHVESAAILVKDSCARFREKRGVSLSTVPPKGSKIAKSCLKAEGSRTTKSLPRVHAS